MKRIFSLLIACVLMLGLLSGCGGTQVENDSNTIKVLYEGWVNGAVPTDWESNPYKKVIDETYDVDWQLSLTSDIDNEILKRFSSTRGD